MQLKRRVFIVDDHEIVRRGLHGLFDREPDFCVCGEADCAADALSKLNDLRPDLVLSDLMLEGRTGLEIIRHLAGEPDAPHVLIVSMYDEPVYVRRCLAAGARGYVPKGRPALELLQAARTVLDGQVYVSDSKQDSWSSSDGGLEPITHLLTDREFEVFLLLGQGFAPRHVAERLSLSVSTVEVYRQRLKEKLEIESSPRLLRYAISWCKHHDVP